jgi:DNA-binding NarL/FixJ family response regulator
MNGKANKVIASDLGISLKTVEQHRSRMMSKLGVRKVADIFRLLHGTDPRGTTRSLRG